MDRQSGGQIVGWIYSRMEGESGGQTIGWTEKTDEQTIAWTVQKVRRTDSRVDIQPGTETDRRANQTAEPANGQTDRQTDRQTGRQTGS